MEAQDVVDPSRMRRVGGLGRESAGVLVNWC